MVLPWLLGPPSEASKVESVGGGSSAIADGAEIQAIELSDGQLQDRVEVAEKVYISKITPLDAQTDKPSSAAKNIANDNAKTDQKTDEKATTKTASDTSVSEAAKSEPVISKAELDAVKAAESQAAEKREQVKAEKAAQDKKNAELAKAKKNKEKREKEQREKELQAQLAAESNANSAKASTVEVGWVVQVGLFTEKSRALALISELKDSGFTASNSVVDTNRGPKTGTRVWLGPFAKRSAAQSEQKQ